MSLTTDLQQALLAQGATIRAAWVEAVTNHTQGNPRAYAHTYALTKALNLDATLRSIRVLELDGQYRIVGTIVLSGSLVLDAHRAAQIPLSAMGKNIAWKVRFGKTNPKSAGVVGSMQPIKRPYLLDYLAAGPNVANQPLVYRYLGQPPMGTTRAGTKGAIITEFAAKLGFTLESAPTAANIYGGTIRLQDTGNSIIKTAVLKAIGSK